METRGCRQISKGEGTCWIMCLKSGLGDDQDSSKNDAFMNQNCLKIIKCKIN